MPCMHDTSTVPSYPSSVMTCFIPRCFNRNLRCFKWKVIPTFYQSRCARARVFPMHRACILPWGFRRCQRSPRCRPGGVDTAIECSVEVEHRRARGVGAIRLGEYVSAAVVVVSLRRARESSRHARGWFQEKGLHCVGQARATREEQSKMSSCVRLAWLYAQPTLDKAHSTTDWVRGV